MQSLPSKPWKKVIIDELGEDGIRLTFLSELENEAQFEEVIEEDIVASLGPDDRIGEPDWPSRSVTLTTSDLRAFKRKLVYASIMIENDD
jgi:hypothetical protein|tara:strand:+ start:920 stop:1189 length:270 start_codon:yes stop_codon:yes gene_type:complete